jgi:hypothetical protein
MQEEIKIQLNVGNAWENLVQNVLSSRMLPTDIQIRLYKIMILSQLLYGCESWSFYLRKEHILVLRGFENIGEEKN